MSLSVAVVGAGIVGLSTAINVQTLISGVKVTIIADSFGRDTTTPVSPGLFLPIPSNLNMDQVLASEWLIDGWEHHYQMAKSPEGEISGQTFLSGHCLWSKPMEHGDYIIPKLVQDYKPLSDKEIQTMSHHKFGARFTTVAVDMGKYLPWRMKEFRSRGGNLISDIVYSLQELYGKYDIVVNCTGVRAREVVNDPGLMQVKAHALQVSKQWKKEFLIMDNDIFILPQ
ncbi:unnamed protein product [Lymnaea stagnalis]|uniref:FAD dependent oxidoreductase domain-containing protein n=1 Tax=Lymnaea stagnalis TaxID=6523 RepID=A0AAV2I9V8_LYMST